MSPEQQGGEKQSGSANRPDGKENRQRAFRSKRRSRKPGDGGGDAREQPSPLLKAQDKAQRERRERRRRRRLKAKQQRSQGETRPEVIAPDPELDLPPKSVFVYTHVIRPAVRDSYEFRSEHFSKVTRRLEDFHIDLSPYFRSEEEAAKRAQAASTAGPADELDDDAWDDEEWDGENELTDELTDELAKEAAEDADNDEAWEDPEDEEQYSQDEIGIEGEPE